MEPKSIDRLFCDAAQIDSPVERQAYLEQACGDDARLRQKLEKLLEIRAQAEDFLESPPAAVGATVDEPVPQERPGTVIGPYKLLEQIGEGGFGVVFMAEQTQPVRRKVALKILKPGMDTRQVVARFEAERQALAIMDHPNIAKVFDGGATASGRPYFMMELVKGVPITEFCDQQQLTPRQRLELFVSLCQAVQHAHHKGIIHRDLKPSNVLVTVHDTTPVVKVIDFGVAKALGQDLTDKTLFTGFGQMIGTPLYMSPEQAGQSGLDIDTRSDIYSLGVLLYELLTGTTPFDKERLKEMGYDELRRIIREEEPPRPSTRISTLGQASITVSAQRKSDPKRLSQLCRGELDWIVMKCLEKDRNRRYETASALAADVQRYLADEPVQACPPTTGYKLRKFIRKYRRPLLGATVVFLLLLAGIVGTSYGVVRAVDEKRNADKARSTAEVNESQALIASAQLRVARDALALNLYAARANLIQNAWEAHGVANMRTLLAEQRPREGERDLRGFEWYYWDRRANAELTVEYPASPEDADTRVLSPDGRRQAILWSRGGGKNALSKVEVRDVLSRTSVASFDVSIPESKTVTYTWLGFTSNSDGLFVSAVSHGKGGDRKIHWWLFDPASGKELVPHQVAPCEEIHPSDVGWDRTLVAAPMRAVEPEKGSRLKLWTLATGREALTCDGTFDTIHRAAFRPGGKEVAAIVTTATPEKKLAIKIWDTATGRERLSLPAGHYPQELVWSPDGRRLAHSSFEAPNLRIWDTADGRSLLALTEPNEAYENVIFSPDGAVVACAVGSGSTRFVILRDTATGRARATLHLTDVMANRVAFSADGARLMTLSRFGTVRTWDATMSDRPTALPMPANLSFNLVNGPPGVAIGADGKRVALFGENEESAILQVWDRTGKSLLTITRPYPRGQPPFTRAVHSVAVSPDGRRVAWAFGRGTAEDRVVGPGARLTVIDLPTRKDLWSQQLDWYPGAFWFSPDGRRLATCVQLVADRKQPSPGVVKFLDVESGAEVHSFPTGFNRGVDLLLARNGDRLFGLVCPDRAVKERVNERVYPFKLWDLRDGTEIASGNYPPELVESFGMQAMALSPDGTRLAISWRQFDATDGVVRVFDVSSGRELRTLNGLDMYIGSLAFSPDGTRLAAAGRSVKIWDPATGQELITFRDAPYGVENLEFSEDGHRLRALTREDEKLVVKTWDATPRVGSR